MESPNISRYRIKLEHKINKDGYKVEKYYPQYKSKLFGWRYMYSFLTGGDDSTLLPSMHFGMMLLFAFSIVSWLSGAVILVEGILFGIPLIIVPFFVLWISAFLINRFSEEYRVEETSKESAKRWITRRINDIIKEQDKKKRTEKTRESLPNNEVFYLDIKSERKAKLQKIKRKSLFKL